ncbi:MAG: NAD-dependent 4,6-dehydratase LegB [Syntrophobacteraceae bacterium]
MNLQDKKILVTGADGFIGSHLTEELVRLGYNVRAFVLYNSFNSWGWLDHASKDIVASIEVFAGDIRDFHCVREAMRGCDLVFHLAALIAIPYSYLSPQAYVDTNVKGTLNIVQAAREQNVAKVVHTSTSEVYGSARFVPITEDHPLQGQSPYSASKIGADHIAMSFFHSFDLPVALIRPFNCYGPRQSTRALIPTVITQLSAKQHTIRLGALYPTRDFNYVKDTVSGFVAVAEADCSVGQVINIGSGHEISVLDTVNIIAEIMGKDIQIEAGEERFRPPNSEVERLCADNQKARDLLGWSPRYGGIEGLRKGLTETIEWFAQPANRNQYKAGYTV